jgi:hypothetical protein
VSSSDFSLRLATEPVVCAALEDIARAGARRALQKAIEDLVPWLYLKGISTGEMPDALVHLGFDGAGLSPSLFHTFFSVHGRNCRSK